MDVYNAQTLFDTLKELQVIPFDKLQEAFEQSNQQKIPFDQVLVQKDLISDENIGKEVAELIGIPYISLTTMVLPDAGIKILPEEFAKEHHVVVFSVDDEVIKIAATNPKDTTLLSFIEKKAGKRVQFYYSTKREIEKALRVYNSDLQKKIDDLMKKKPGPPGVVDEVPITEIVTNLINYAYSSGASDIHIEPRREMTIVRFRIDGVMHQVLQFSPVVHKQVLSRIKVLSKLRTDEHFSSQDGKMQIILDNEPIDIRVSIVPLAHGEDCVMRLLASNHQQYGLRDLGMSEKDLQKVTDGFTKPHGMILSTGPTGSGKSTSMYAILKIISTPAKNISTIEDPVEYDMPGINQIQVNAATNLTFAEGLRSILRQDPDIIYVGEIRDNETAEIAINSALTGHLVLSTLHTNDAATTLPRLIEMQIEPFLIASTINVVIGQRLVRKICGRCKVSYIQSSAELLQNIPQEILKNRLEGRASVTLYKGKGCEVCHNTGYIGRLGIFEVLVVSDTIRALINANDTSDSIRQKAIDEGMTTMMEDGFEKVLQGITTIEEIMRTTKE
jgi:type IV pilus assembly protein PilB